MEGEKIYRAAILLTDRHQRRFQDMLASDVLESEIERQYFTDDFDWMPLMGWQEFCSKMQESGQGEWLTKINRLDEDVMLGLLERRLLEAIEGRVTENGGRVINKDVLDGAVKALQGMVSRSKAISELTEQEKSGTAEVIVKFIGSCNNPISGISPLPNIIPEKTEEKKDGQDE